MTLEEKLANWTKPSSNTEKDKQDRTERMIRAALEVHPPFNECNLKVYSKGSYPNNTNVRFESDVDIMVECTDVEYYDEAGDTDPSIYRGQWTPTLLRAEVTSALLSAFPTEVDDTGNVAINVRSSSARVDADVVPGFSYVENRISRSRPGTRTFSKKSKAITNYPQQQLDNGRSKNNATAGSYKKCVRIMKRVANLMEEDGSHIEVPSYFVECLVYQCPNSIFTRSTWTDRIKGVIAEVYHELAGEEPTDSSDRWTEVNEIKFLFHDAQKWTRASGRAFALAAWQYLELENE